MLGEQAREEQVALLGQALLQDEAALKRATDLAIANIAGPQVAKAAAPAAKVIADLQDRQTMNEIALETAIRNGDEELAEQIRAAIIDIEKVKTVQCKKESKKSCNGKSTKCLTHNLWDELENHINDFFEKKSLEDLVKENIERRI